MNKITEKGGAIPVKAEIMTEKKPVAPRRSHSLLYGVALSVFRVWCIENQSVQRSGASEGDRSDIGVPSE